MELYMVSQALEMKWRKLCIYRFKLNYRTLFWIEPETDTTDNGNYDMLVATPVNILVALTKNRVLTTYFETKTIQIVMYSFDNKNTFIGVCTAFC